MKRIGWKIAAAMLSPLVFAVGCSGDQLPSDSGYYQDNNHQNSDGIRLCAQSKDCLLGEECRDGVCATAKTCQCNSECDKARGERCATGLCVTAAPIQDCTSDCDCYTGESCVSRICVPTGGDVKTCTVDGDCGAGEVCQDGKCVPVNCATKEDCMPPTCVCKGGDCTAPPPVCQGDADCCVEFKCNFGTCIPNPTGCKSDDECKNKDPEFPRCDIETGNCLPECYGPEDCPDEKSCVNTHCVYEGCTKESCAQGQWCDTGDGQCKPGCDSNEDCTAPQTCNYSTHECGTPPDCCGGACNPANQYCDNLTCQCRNKCASSADCPAGYACQPDGRCWCSATSCPPNTTCNAATGECIQDSCLSDVDCPAGWTCNLATGQCESGNTMGEGDFCFTDTNCNQAAQPALMCDNCIFCVMVDQTFVPTFTCRYKCGLFQPCPATAEGQQCKLRRLMISLCMP